MLSKYLAQFWACDEFSVNVSYLCCPCSQIASHVVTWPPLCRNSHQDPVGSPFLSCPIIIPHKAFGQKLCIKNFNWKKKKKTFKEPKWLKTWYGNGSCPLTRAFTSMNTIIKGLRVQRRLLCSILSHLPLNWEQNYFDKCIERLEWFYIL